MFKVTRMVVGAAVLGFALFSFSGGPIQAETLTLESCKDAIYADLTAEFGSKIKAAKAFGVTLPVLDVMVEEACITELEGAAAADAERTAAAL